MCYVKQLQNQWTYRGFQITNSGAFLKKRTFGIYVFKCVLHINWRMSSAGKLALFMIKPSQPTRKWKGLCYTKTLDTTPLLFFEQRWGLFNMPLLFSMTRYRRQSWPQNIVCRHKITYRMSICQYWYSLSCQDEVNKACLLILFQFFLAPTQSLLWQN